MSHSKPWLVYANLFYVGMVTFQVCFSFVFCFSFLGSRGSLGGGECLICLIVLVEKLLIGFEALVPPVKNFTLGISIVILDGASIVQMLKGVGVSTAE